MSRNRIRNHLRLMASVLGAIVMSMTCVASASEEKYDSAESWNAWYFYGVTKDNPADIDLPTKELVTLLAQADASYTIAAQTLFDPRFIINPKGLTVWEAEYVFVFQKSRETLKAVFEGRDSVVVPSQFMRSIFNAHVNWPPSVLSKYPFEFGSCRPFVLPFISNAHNANTAGKYTSARDINTRPNDRILVASLAKFDEKEPAGVLAKFVALATEKKILDYCGR